MKTIFNGVYLYFWVIMELLLIVFSISLIFRNKITDGILSFCFGSIMMYSVFKTNQDTREEKARIENELTERREFSKSHEKEFTEWKLKKNGSDSIAREN